MWNDIENKKPPVESLVIHSDECYTVHQEHLQILFVLCCNYPNAAYIILRLTVMEAQLVTPSEACARAHATALTPNSTLRSRYQQLWWQTAVHERRLFPGRLANEVVKHEARHPISHEVWCLIASNGTLRNDRRQVSITLKLGRISEAAVTAEEVIGWMGRRKQEWMRK